MAELLKHSFIDEILIWDNSKRDNLICYARFLLAMKASNEIVYFQDDDCINTDIKKLYREYQIFPDDLIHAATPGYEDALANDPAYKNNNLALIGWGSFVDKKWLVSSKNPFNRYLAKYPEDEYFYLLADRIFTILLPNRRHPVSCKIEHLHGSVDEDAISSRRTHLEEREECFKRCQSL